MTTCVVEECERVAHRWADCLHVCQMHAKRWHRFGRFHNVRVTTPPRERREECTVDGCGKIVDGPHGLCKMHKTRLDRHGDPSVVIEPSDRAVQRLDQHHAWTGDDVTYTGIHQRLRKQLGSPKHFDCVDCQRPAKQWSYDHGDPNERSSKLGPYSPDVAHYVPRCVPCHKRFDLEYLARPA